MRNPTGRENAPFYRCAGSLLFRPTTSLLNRCVNIYAHFAWTSKIHWPTKSHFRQLQVNNSSLWSRRATSLWNRCEYLLTFPRFIQIHWPTKSHFHQLQITTCSPCSRRQHASLTVVNARSLCLGFEIHRPTISLYGKKIKKNWKCNYSYILLYLQADNTPLKTGTSIWRFELIREHALFYKLWKRACCRSTQTGPTTSPFHELWKNIDADPCISLSRKT